MKKLFTTLFISCFAIHVFATGVVATAIGVNPTCNGSCNGSATAMAGGGVGPYGFTWTGPSGYTASGASISGLCAGTYIVTATDSSDMSIALYTLLLSQPPAFAAATTGSTTICPGACTPLTAYATGGTGPYNYSWTPAAGLSATNIANPTSCLTASMSYTVIATDANGCTAAATATVIVSSGLTVTVNSATSCPGQITTLAASGATTYSWSTGTTPSTGNVVTVSPVTTATYTVTGTSGTCSGTAVATVTVNPLPIITLSPTPAICGVCNGSIMAAVSPGGTTFYWSGPGGYTSTMMNPTALCPGSYTVTAVSPGGCSSTASTAVPASSSVVATIGSITPASCGLCNGGATVMVTGGSPPYTFMWSPAGVTTSTVTNLCAGVYSVLVTDANGCSFTAMATIPSASTITAMTSSTPASCGACDGSANVTASGGSGPYTYDWVPGTPSGDGTPSVSSLCPGSYTVTVTDVSSCSSTATVIITNTNPIVVTSAATASDCGACNGTVTVYQSGGVGPYLYDLNNGSPQQTNGNFTGVCAGAYIATVTDNNGCSGIYTILVPSTNSSAITVTNVIQNESGYGLHNGSIDLTVTGSTGPYTFAWSNGATTEDIYSLGAGSYSVTVTDNSGNCGTFNYSISTIPAYGYITGYIYDDNNANCIYDAGDAPHSGYYVNASNGSVTNGAFSNGMGYYSIWLPTGTGYVLTPGTTGGLEPGCTSTYTVNVTSGSTSANNNMAYTFPPFYDVCLYTYCAGIVPGFNGSYNVYLQNYGNQTATGVAYLVLPGILNYISASPAATSISGDTLFWNYTAAPSTNMIFTVLFNTPSSVPLGTVATAYANATVTNGTDINPACNHYIYTRYASGSFDPNEKTVSPSGEGVTGEIPLTEDEFSYFIQFQNTGTGPAVNINVTDTLSGMLDRMSLQMLGASDNYVIEMLPGNVVRWKFDNIMLPASTIDEPGSHGYVHFRINKLNAPVAGEVIENTAYIYFDFNSPVVTNTAINTYALATAINEQSAKDGNVSVYPNPFNDNTTFVIQSDKLNENYSFEMTDVVGKKVKSMNGISEKQFSISRNGLKNGVYFYKIWSSEKVIGIGKLIIE